VARLSAPELGLDGASAYSGSCMSKRTKQQRNDLMELVNGRPGWRLEPRTTPGASPVWCFVANGEIDLSASADDGALHLYVMATDQEFVMQTAEELNAWLEIHRPEALSERQASPTGKARTKGLFEWG
jgi:hypothetical protein